MSPAPAAGGAASRGPSRGWSVLGWLLVALGLGVVGYATWLFVGTNYIAGQRQDRAIAELQERWEDDTAGEDRAGGRATGPGDASLGDAIALVRIPRFGSEYEMPVLQGVEDEQLTSGIGHFEDTAMPGRIGNFALAAHRVTDGEPFADFPGLRIGDEVVVETRTAVFTYELHEDPRATVVTFEETWVLDAVPGSPGETPTERLITLTTCSEIFHTDDRSIAFGRLVSTDQKA